MDQQTKQQLAQTKRRGKNDNFASAADEERVGPLEDEELGVGQVYDVIDAVIVLPAHHRLKLGRRATSKCLLEVRPSEVVLHFSHMR